MCSINVAFNMKTVENVLNFSRISSFETFLEPIFLMFSLHLFYVA